MDEAVKPRFTQFVVEFVIAFFIFLLGLSESLTDSIYSTGAYPYISAILRWITAFFPFAVGDFLYLLLSIYIIRSLNLFYRKYNNKRLVKTDRFNIPLQVLNFLIILYITFKLLWGLNYSRPTITKQLGITDKVYNTEELVSLGNYFLVKLNSLKPVVDSANHNTLHYSAAELEAKADFVYKKLEKVNPLFRYNNPCVKPVLNSWLISKFGVEGYYNPLSGEANINMRLPAYVLPFTTCHEIAHQIGVAREDEANLVGYIVAINSPDVHFQYAAYYCMFRSILWEIRRKSPDDYKLIYSQISPGILADFQTEKDFWRKYNGAMSSYMDVAFDKFLKMNSQDMGINSYQNIVLWLYNFHKDEL